MLRVTLLFNNLLAKYGCVTEKSSVEEEEMVPCVVVAKGDWKG